MTPRPCAYAQGPKKTTPHPSKHIARCIATSNTSLVHATAKRTAVQMDHTGHDAEHNGPASQGRKHSARCNVTSKTSLEQATARKKHVTVLLVQRGEEGKGRERDF